MKRFLLTVSLAFKCQFNGALKKELTRRNMVEEVKLFGREEERSSKQKRHQVAP